MDGVRIEAQLAVIVHHVDGQQIENAAHVAAWICANGAWFTGVRPMSVDYEVCPEHADPDECDKDCDAPTSTYRLQIHGVDSVDVYPASHQPETQMGKQPPADSHMWWLTEDVLAYLAGQNRKILAKTWHSYVSRGQAPAPDYVGRTPRWSPDKVRRWHANSQ